MSFVGRAVAHVASCLCGPFTVPQIRRSRTVALTLDDVHLQHYDLVDVHMYVALLYISPVSCASVCCGVLLVPQVVLHSFVFICKSVLCCTLGILHDGIL